MAKHEKLSVAQALSVLTSPVAEARVLRSIEIANLAYWVTGTEGSNPSLSANQSSKCGRLNRVPLPARLEPPCGAQVSCHRPAHDLAADGVAPHGEIEKAGPGWEVGEVGDPPPIRRRGGAVAPGRGF